MSNHITAPQDCTGCGLCANVCSQNAIQMVWSKDGFLIPKVNNDACVNCGLCVKQCIALEEKGAYSDDLTSIVAYGGWNKNEDTHLKSSSGGIFSALATKVITQGGIVFGVVWKDKLTAVFDKAETTEELALMRGSKYTPAIPNDVYRNVKQELKSNRPVLFSGTPCQVHALKKYLGKDYDNLLTIDIVCHGVPSHLLLEKYIAEAEKNEGKKAKYISFRDKPEGWKNYHVAIHYDDNSTSSVSLQNDIYMKLFLSDQALNYACYNCPYAHIPRQGDITLGDFWGVENHHSDWPIDKGISAVMAYTVKGKNSLQDISSSAFLKEEPFQNIYSGQSVVYIRPHRQIPADRALVLEKLTKCPLKRIIDKIINTVKIRGFRLKRYGLIHKTWLKLKKLKQKTFTLIFRKSSKSTNLT